MFFSDQLRLFWLFFTTNVCKWLLNSRSSFQPRISLVFLLHCNSVTLVSVSRNPRVAIPSVTTTATAARSTFCCQRVATKLRRRDATTLISGDSATKSSVKPKLKKNGSGKRENDPEADQVRLFSPVHALNLIRWNEVTHSPRSRMLKWAGIFLHICLYVSRNKQTAWGC